MEDELSDGGRGWATYYVDSGEIEDTETTEHENISVTNARVGELKLSMTSAS